MVTIAEIAAEAFDDVAADITDAVQAFALIKATQGDYDVATGLYDTAELELTGRAVLESLTPQRMAAFPAYVAGPSDQAYLLEGVADVAENDHIWFGAYGADNLPLTKIIRAVQSVGGSDSVFNVIAA